LKTKIVIDTSVVIEYIDRAGPWHRLARAIFNRIVRGQIIAYIPAIILSEVLYVARKIYGKVGLSNPKDKAVRLVRWLYQHPNIRVVGRNLRLIVLAGLIKTKYHLAMSDCYVLALAKLLKAKPLFRKKEKEMMKHMNTLRRLYGIVFLEDY